MSEAKRFGEFPPKCERCGKHRPCTCLRECIGCSALRARLDALEEHFYEFAIWGTPPELRAGLEEVKDTRNPVDLDAARAALQRMIDYCFNNVGKERPRFRIPAQSDDDDLIVSAALDELRELRAVVAGTWHPSEGLMDAIVSGSVVEFHRKGEEE